MSEDSKSDYRLKDNLYPEKPASELGFKKAVAWFGGRELIASLKDMLIYGIFGENIDPRAWMNPNIYPGIYEEFLDQEKRKEKQSLEEVKAPDKIGSETLFTSLTTEASKNVDADSSIKDAVCERVREEWAKKIFDHWEWKKNYYQVWDEFLLKDGFRNKVQPENQEIKEFWFDFIADSGDGQLGVYNVACLCLSDLWLDREMFEENQTELEVRFKPPKAADLHEKILLPRGAFLFVGGDTAYHTANYETLVERFQHPFRWAFTDVRKYNEEFYKLKPAKKAEAENFAKQNLNPTDRESVNFREELSGSLPGAINDVNYYDTEPTRPIFGIPANHDYYDGIDGFNRQFRRPPFDNVEENMIFNETRGKFLLQIPTFSRKQEASYIAVSLPFHWWFFGIDSENEKLDFRQELYFDKIVELNKPKKLILATPEPTTVFGKISDPEDKTATYLKAVTEALGLSQPFLTDGQFVPLEKSKKKDSGKKEAQPDLTAEYCRLDLSGDVHHYARYWGEDTRLLDKDKNRFHSDNYASLVAGGGGAFFDVTKTLIGEPLNRQKNPVFKDKKVKGEIPPQKVFPSEQESVSKTADKLFDIWNIRRGGYVQFAGFAIAAILFYFLNYFSNFSRVLKEYNLVSPFKAELFWSNRYLICLLWFFVTGIFTTVTVFMVNNLIETLKEKSFKGILDENVDASIRQISKRYIPLLFSIPFYFFALANFFDNRYPVTFTPDLDNFLISCNLIVVFINFLLLIWLSSEHTNWLAVRFKIVRKYRKKTVTQKLEDPNYTKKSMPLRILGGLSRLYSYHYFLSNVLVLAAIALLVTAINIFGTANFARTLADIVLILIFVGFLVLVVGIFGVKMGASYHRSAKYKVYFFVFGLWHFILQVGTPLVLFMYGSWWFLLINFIVIALLNGSALISFLVRYFIVQDDKKSDWEVFANFRIAAQITKYFNKYALFGIWLIYGLAILIIPLLNQPHSSIYVSIRAFFEKYYRSFPGYEAWQNILIGFFNVSPATFETKIVEYATIWVSILVIGYIGFLMSRIWFGWYLAVSMMFDGHNNEAGGAARIEGFKHILRVKVEEDKLTVFVIGFDEAQPDVRDLKLKLVDKFTLKCQPPDRSK